MKLLDNISEIICKINVPENGKFIFVGSADMIL